MIGDTRMMAEALTREQYEMWLEADWPRGWCGRDCLGPLTTGRLTVVEIITKHSR